MRQQPARLLLLIALPIRYRRRQCRVAPRTTQPNEGKRDDEPMAEACLAAVALCGPSALGGAGARGGANQAGRRDAVCALRDAGAGLARSGGGAAGFRHAVLGAVRAARRAGEADAGTAHGAEPRRILDRERGQAGLRIQPAQGPEIPQRRPVHRRGREVQLRAREGGAAEGEGEGGRHRRPVQGAVRAARAVAGLHDVLRHACQRRRLDRAEELLREGRPRRLQEAPDRPRPLQVRQHEAGHRTGDGGERGLLAQGAVGQTHRLPERPGSDHPPRDR